jgi:hypothetical protein
VLFNALDNFAKLFPLRVSNPLEKQHDSREKEIDVSALAILHSSGNDFHLVIKSCIKRSQPTKVHTHIPPYLTYFTSTESRVSFRRV